jgi:hypothetical protein
MFYRVMERPPTGPCARPHREPHFAVADDQFHLAHADAGRALGFLIVAVFRVLSVRVRNGTPQDCGLLSELAVNVPPDGPSALPPRSTSGTDAPVAEMPVCR